MLRNFDEVMEKAKSAGKTVLSVAVAQDKDVLLAVKAAAECGLAQAVLVGDETKIRTLLVESEMTHDVTVIHEPDDDTAALRAVELVRTGEAQVLVKGLINSSNFLRAVLHPEKGLRSGKMLSHLMAFEIPGEPKLAFHTDGGMNVAPGLEEKKQIMISALEALRAMGIAKPNVAILAANEQVNPKIPATVDAQALAAMAAAGKTPPCVAEGPIAMDVASSKEAAQHKGIQSQIAGDVDLFLMPTIEAGNLVGKALIHYAKAKNAGLILGATHPIVMVSRSDEAAAKLYSIALACLISGDKRIVVSE